MAVNPFPLVFHRPRQKDHLEGQCRFGELCGRATAEGAAICCCCPLAIAKFLVLAIYKIPARLCHRAISKVQRRKGLIEPRNQQGGCGCDNRDFQIQPVERVEGSEESQKAVKELEKEMLQKFYGSRFWRSPNCQSRI
ncbi:hypothetical protein F3Y22_tig00110895pilonHSYRG00843 [Hibiscus syriacus]|uniref:Uncharacterized protein n=1 Tax=Hibiscus syriacus TaxID=106335 RepID=A0A6A2ZFT9_HIBSY|nr:uncharacterized protein LOC120146090 [Hibiscus syriacus]KAE8690563.1 hypothetical protein F3Y22_tig00110895pilonHSYRG00843 [Hibiscus syriacus]